jgi:ATP-dependent Zn protease
MDERHVWDKSRSVTSILLFDDVAEKIIKTNLSLLNKITEALINKTTLNKEDLKKIIENLDLSNN